MPQRPSPEKPPRPPARATYLIAQAWYALRDRVDAALKQHGVTGIQYTVLSVLAGRDNLSPAQLSRRFYVTQQAMGQMLTNLQEAGLLTRTEDPSNRRILRVALTDAGRKLVRQCDAEMKAIEEEAFAGLSASELDALRTTLQSVAQNMRNDTASGAR